MEIIAEVGLAHDGSLSQAHAYIDAIAKAGADTAKFQCHWLDSTDEWRIKPKRPQDESRQAYWERTQFSLYQWQGLAEHCAEAGVEFLCSPFSVLAVRMLDSLVKRWKVPSGHITNMALLDAIRLTSKPVILSTGMATHAETQAAVNVFRGSGVKHTLLQCCSKYPCPPEEIGLGNLDWLRGDPEKHYPIGLSDHSGTIYPGLAAAALGLNLLEVHVCWSKDQGGFDTEASITTAQLAELVKVVRFIEKAMQPLDKDKAALDLGDTRRLFMPAKASA